MMKRLIPVLILSTLAMGASSGKKGFLGWGIGGGLSLAVPDYGWSHWDYWDNYYNGYNYGNGCDNIGPGGEVIAPIRFGIGKAGYIHYVPGISWWSRWENVDYNGNQGRLYYKLHDSELNFNLFDARYSPPIPASFPVKPFIGGGLLGFSVYHWRDEYTGDHRRNSSADFALIQNFMVGSEFMVTKEFMPYVEFKISNGDIYDYQFIGGFTVQIRK